VNGAANEFFTEDEQHAPVRSTREIRFTSPSTAVLLSNISQEIFQMPPDVFDEKLEALSGLEQIADNAALSEKLLDRVEQVDMARDAVKSQLSASIRRSAEGIIAGMQQVHTLDTDITHTTLFGWRIFVLFCLCLSVTNEKT
jgi:hypothetical protein